MKKMLPIPLDGLNHEWKLYGFTEGSLHCSSPVELDHLDLEPVPAQVPGNVELDWLRAGKLEDPFFGRNIHRLRALETYEWWYIREFDLPPLEHAGDWELVFEGLDLLAEVWVNNTRIGGAANMLVPHRFSVSSLLRWGENNTLAVHLASAMNQARRMVYAPQDMSWEQRWEGLRLRKAPHVWGWDILPRAVSAGIWRSVHLNPISQDGIDWIYYWTRMAESGSAQLGVRFQIRIEGSLEGLRLHFSGACEEHRFEYDWPLEFTAGGCTIPVPEPRLWWPKGYGQPNLYDLTVRLYRGQTLLAERMDRIGLRSVEVSYTPTAGSASEVRDALPTSPRRWDREPDPEHHFLFRVNGHPIQIKGTNWVPLDAFHSRDAARLPRALALADQAGCNMIRCWGGNVYENEAFFNFCDEHGILIWQDMAFACCAYPQDEAFLQIAREETEKIALRLRNHPCLALWCGDNENDMLYLTEGLDPAHNRLTREVIPAVLRRLDPHRAYLPGSPYHSPEAVRSKLPTPEQHLWGPRGYFKNPFYTRHSAHFIGEIGYHGCPSPASLEKFLSPADLWPWHNNPAWQDHAVYHWQHNAIDRDRIQLMANQIREFFGIVPGNLVDFSLASQITQAEAKKFFIESTRLRKWNTSGIIWWNLMDGWPQFSDAVVDYYFEPKLAYEYICRAQTPVGLVVGEPGTGKYLPLVACNDTLDDAEITFSAWDADTQEILAVGTAVIPANQNWQVGRIRAYASDHRLILLRWQMDGRAYCGHYLAGSPPFDLNLYKGWLRKIQTLAVEASE